MYIGILELQIYRSLVSYQMVVVLVRCAACYVILLNFGDYWRISDWLQMGVYHSWATFCLFDWKNGIISWNSAFQVWPLNKLQTNQDCCWTLRIKQSTITTSSMGYS